MTNLKVKAGTVGEKWAFLTFTGARGKGIITLGGSIRALSTGRVVQNLFGEIVAWYLGVAQPGCGLR